MRNINVKIKISLWGAIKLMIAGILKKEKKTEILEYAPGCFRLINVKPAKKEPLD